MRLLIAISFLLCDPFTRYTDNLDCIQESKIFYHHEQMCMSQLDAYRMIQKWTSYGGIRR